MRTPIRNPPDPMYAELEVHRTMIRDRVRTEAFRRAIESAVRPGDVVLDVGAGSGTFRHLWAGDRRSEPGRLWTTNAELIPLAQAQAPHEAET